MVDAGPPQDDPFPVEQQTIAPPFKGAQTEAGLRRIGAKKAPFYRIVVADSRFPRDGRFIEEIGTYDPNKEPSEVKIDAEKAKQWIANGAQPTDTVRVLLKKSNVL